MIILRTGGLQRERQVRADVRGRQERGRARRGGRQRQECPRLQGTIVHVTLVQGDSAGRVQGGDWL